MHENVSEEPIALMEDKYDDELYIKALDEMYTSKAAK